MAELTGEGIRWFDLKRWNYFNDPAGVNAFAAHDVDFSSFVVGKSGLLPLPQTEINLA